MKLVARFRTPWIPETILWIVAIYIVFGCTAYGLWLLAGRIG